MKWATGVTKVNSEDKNIYYHHYQSLGEITKYVEFNLVRTLKT